MPVGKMLAKPKKAPVLSRPTTLFSNLEYGSGGWIRTNDLRVMSSETGRSLTYTSFNSIISRIFSKKLRLVSRYCGRLPRFFLSFRTFVGRGLAVEAGKNLARHPYNKLILPLLRFWPFAPSYLVCRVWCRESDCFDPDIRVLTPPPGPFGLGGAWYVKG